MKRYDNKYPMNMNRQDSRNWQCGNYTPTQDDRPMYAPQGIQTPMEEDDDFDENDNFDENDRQYMLSLYPDLCQRIQRLSEDECDKLEYEGSLMFDEYPDKKEIDKIVARIYVIVEKEQVLPKATQEVETLEKTVEAQQVIVPVGYPWLWNNVQVGFLNELFGRRRRRFPRHYRYPYQFQPYPRYRPRYYPYQPFVPYQPYVPYYYRY